MANIERGEVELVVNDRVYTLKLTTNAAIAMQTRTKKTFGQLAASAVELDIEAIRDIIFMLLQKHHAQEFKTLTSVGEFIDDAGGVKVFFETLEKLQAANQAAEDAANPQTAQGQSTGESLSEAPVATVA